MIGYVYIMINTAFPDLIKIGRTTKNSDDRAGELYSTGTPGKFIVVYDLLVDNCDEIEKELHAYYADKRYSNSREFFSVSTKDAIVKLQEISEGRLATTLDFDVKNTVDKELYNGDLATIVNGISQKLISIIFATYSNKKAVFITLARIDNDISNIRSL
jgi:hypothetical protein